MTDRAKFEQMLDCLINEDRARAEELFHEIVVAKSREIYENILSDEFGIEECGMEEDDIEEEVETDEKADDFVNDTEDKEPPFGDEGEEEGEEGEEDEVELLHDIKDELEELVAKFNALMADEADEPEHKDLFGDEEEEGEEESFQMREYVEKVDQDWGTNFMTGETNVNATSTVASKNDMGGTAGNLNQSQVGSDKGAIGGLINKPQDMKTGNVNVPGAKNADQLNKVGKDWDKTKSSAEQSVNDKAVIGKRVR